MGRVLFFSKSVSRNSAKSQEVIMVSEVFIHPRNSVDAVSIFNFKGTRRVLAYNQWF